MSRQSGHEATRCARPGVLLQRVGTLSQRMRVRDSLSRWSYTVIKKNDARDLERHSLVSEFGLYEYLGLYGYGFRS